MQDQAEVPMTREELSTAMSRDADGMRQLQQYLDEIKDFDDATFAEATGGADRTEMMELLGRLTKLLDDLDKLTAELHGDVS
jgi:hypothetical protein